MHHKTEQPMGAQIGAVPQARKQSPCFTFRGVTYENDMPVVSPRTQRTRQSNPAAGTGPSNDQRYRVEFKCIECQFVQRKLQGNEREELIIKPARVF